MTNDEIEKAVENLKQCIVENYKDTPVKFSTVDSRDIHTLLILAEEYLKVEGWPEEQSVNPNKMVNIWAEGFNEALHICKLTAMKEKNRLSEGIRNIMSQPIDRISEITVESYKQIRQKLLKLVNTKD